MTKTWRAIVLITLLLLGTPNSIVFAQDETESVSFLTRVVDTVQAVGEWLSGDDAAAAAEAEPAADDALVEEEPTFFESTVVPVLPSIIAGVALAGCIILVYLGHQKPSKRRDPFYRP